MHQCEVIMANGKPCGIETSSGINGKYVCYFHGGSPSEDFHTKIREKIYQETNDKNIKFVDLTGYVFREYSFDEFEFSKSVNFTDATFYGKVSFRRCKFLGSTNYFNNAEFGGLADFNLAQFSGFTDFSEAKFMGEAIFYTTLFLTDKVSFNLVEFKSEAIFSQAFFNGRAYFLKTHFSGKKVIFENTHFVGNETSFFESIFDADETEFLNAVFGSKISFDHCIFKNRVRFLCNQYINYAFAYLETLPFESTMLDIRLQFHKELKLLSTAFQLSEEKRDSLLKVSEDAKYRTAINELHRRSCAKSFLLPTSIQNVKTEDAQLIQFRHVDLSQTELRGTNLRNIEFIDVTWCDIKRFRFWLPSISNFKGLYDEIILFKNDERPQSEIELTRHAYRQLKHNYEENKNYYQADYFYFGEMEMARYKIKNIFKRNIFSWQAIYRWVSGYGQQWENSLFFMFVLTFGLPVLFLLLGLQVVIPIGSTNQEFWFCANYWHTLQYNFLTITFQKDISELYSPSILTRNISIIESLVMPVLATLFVLALRRKFKR